MSSMSNSLVHFLSRSLGNHYAIFKSASSTSSWTRISVPSTQTSTGNLRRVGTVSACRQRSELSSGSAAASLPLISGSITHINCSRHIHTLSPYKYSAVGVNKTLHKCSSTGSGMTDMTEHQLKREMDDLTDQFMEARELLADAMETKGTVYFNDDLEDAKESVQETLARYKELLGKLSEDQERNVRRTIGLKMEELRAQQNMLSETLKED